jgi:rRNA maturation endonuclease Nob1
MTFVAGKIKRVCSMCKEEALDERLKICTNCGEDLPRDD